MHAASVRAAGTSTIRRAREDTGFMAEAEAALGHPIEIISGIEEARLIYNGVTHSLPPERRPAARDRHRRRQHRAHPGAGTRSREALESLHLGCVSMTERFFPDGKLTRQAFDAARVAARLELRPVKAFFRDAAGVEAIGTSGTILSTTERLRAARHRRKRLDLQSCRRLIEPGHRVRHDRARCRCAACPSAVPRSGRVVWPSSSS